jgi:hypothetical protein
MRMLSEDTAARSRSTCVAPATVAAATRADVVAAGIGAALQTVLPLFNLTVLVLFSVVGVVRIFRTRFWVWIVCVGSTHTTFLSLETTLD